jgi:TRAP-type mannitol/chloroaromatic compound transport system permease small subunit
MSIIYTYGRNNHVRVDVFREKQLVKMQQLVDIISIVLFLIPFFFLTLYWVWPDIVYAWQITEGSRETGGLPGLFLVKSSLPLMCILMIVQSLFIVIRRGQFMALNEDDKPQSLAETQEAV